jgi:2,3,4,5-tetrahydropyridine-2,6-dicarboxylate N-succinyltransferase
MGSPAAYGIGLATRDGRSGRLLDAWFPVLGLAGARADAVDALVPGSGTRSVELDIVAGGDPDVARIMAASGTATTLGGTRIAVAVLVDDLATAPGHALEATLRLHLLSHRLVRPHGSRSTACSAAPERRMDRSRAARGRGRRPVRLELAARGSACTSARSTASRA